MITDHWSSTVLKHLLDDPVQPFWRKLLNWSLWTVFVQITHSYVRHSKLQTAFLHLLLRGQDQIDTPQVSPQVAKKPSINDAIWLKLGAVSPFTNLQNLLKSHESSWFAWVGIVSIYNLYAYGISANEFLHEQVPGIVHGTLSCASRRTWAFRLCSRLSRPKLCFGLSIFGVLLLFC